MSLSPLNFALALAEFAPLITRWITGEQSEKAVRKVVDAARTLTGEKDTLKILRALEADPKLLVEFQRAILKMENNFNLEELKDRENARLRDMALAHAGRSNLRADIMVLSAALGLVACLVTIALYRTSLPGEVVGIISTIAGIFGSCLKDAYAFEFGSSRGSKLKDTKLSAMLLPR